MSAAIILFDSSPRNASSGAEVSVRLAGGGAERAHLYFSDNFMPGILTLPAREARLGWDGAGWGAGAVPQQFELQFAAHESQIASLASLYWPDALFTLMRGPEGGNLSAVASGSVVDVSIRDGKFSIKCADATQRLTVPVLTDRYQGSGGFEGGSDIKGQLKKRYIEWNWNVECLAEDAVNNIWAWADHARSHQAVVAVKDRGIIAASLAVVGWAGSAAATRAALIASVPPAGGASVAPSICRLKWWNSNPARPLTIDIRGEAGLGGDTVAHCISRLMVDASDLPQFSAPRLAAHATARPAPAGIAIDDDESFADVLDQVLARCSSYWRGVPGGLDIDVLDWTRSPVAVLKPDRVARKRVFAPHYERRVGYQKNNRVHTDGEIATSLLVGSSTPLLKLEASSQTFRYDGAGQASPAGQSISLDATLLNSSDAITWSTVPVVFLGGSGTTRTISIADFGSNARVKVTVAGASQTSSITISRLADGAPGADGGPQEFFQQDSAPANPLKGWIWFRPSTKELRIYDNLAWRLVGGGGALATFDIVDTVNISANAVSETVLAINATQFSPVAPISQSFAVGLTGSVSCTYIQEPRPTAPIAGQTWQRPSVEGVLPTNSFLRFSGTKWLRVARGILNEGLGEGVYEYIYSAELFIVSGVKTPQGDRNQIGLMSAVFNIPASGTWLFDCYAEYRWIGSRDYTYPYPYFWNTDAADTTCIVSLLTRPVGGGVWQPVGSSPTGLPMKAGAIIAADALPGPAETALKNRYQSTAMVAPIALAAGQHELALVFHVSNGWNADQEIGFRNCMIKFLRLKR
jgi:hypothetical protein